MAVWYREDLIRNFSSKKTFLQRQCKNRCDKNDISCVISYLGTSERRKLNKVPALSMNSFSLEVWCGLLVIEDQRAAIYGFSLQKTFVISTVQK